MEVFNKLGYVPALAVGLIVGISGSAAAAGPDSSYPGNEIVVTATRTPNPVSKLPVAVEVIGREQIEQSGALNLADVLAEAHDVNALEPASGRLGVARLRGLDSRMTLVLIDGFRINSGFQGYLDLREIPAGLIERIEIVRGSGSALYGSDAVGGVVNIITRKPSKEGRGGLSLSGAESRYGQAGSVQTEGWFSGTAGKLGYAVSGSYYDRDRYDRNRADLTTDGDDRSIGSGSATLTYDLQPGLRLSGGFLFGGNSLDGIRTQGTTNSDRRVESERLLVHAGAEIRTGAESSLSLQVSRNTYDWKSDMAFFSGVPTLRDTNNLLLDRKTHTETISNYSSFTKLTQTSDQLDLRWSGTWWESHRVTGGVECRTEKRTDDSDTVSQVVTTVTRLSNGALISGPATQYTHLLSTGAHDAHNLGLYLQDELAVTGNLKIIGGVRYDDHSDFGSEFSPKVAALLRIDEHLKLRASYGEGFRAPSLYELYTGALRSRNSTVLPNASLQPETSKSYELGAELSFAGVDAGVTAFRTDIRNLISQETFDATTSPITYRFENLAEAMSRGIEIDASRKLSAVFTLSDKVTFLDTAYETKGTALPFAPNVANIIKLSYADTRLGLKGNLRLVTTGKQYTLAGAKADGYSLVNCFLSKTVSRGCELFAGADNLFNIDPGAAYGNNEGAGLTGTYLYCGLNWKL